jgi:hypothetical protein
MVDASDGDGSSLSFNSGGVVASSRRPPSSWRPPLGLAMISPECPPPRVSLVVDLLFLDNSEGLDDISGEWPFYMRLGLHLLNTEERGTRTAAIRGSAGPNGPVDLGLLGSVSAQLSPRSISCTLDHWPLQLWALDVVTSTIKLRDLYAWTSSLWTLVGMWSELLDWLAKRSPN